MVGIGVGTGCRVVLGSRVIAVLALVVILGLVSPATAAHAAVGPARAVSLSEVPQSGTPTHRDLTGAVSPRRGKVLVSLDRYLGAGRWVVVARQLSDGSGRFRFRVPTPATYGVTGFRARLVPTRVSRSAVSPVVRVVVLREPVVTADASTYDVSRGTLVTVTGSVTPPPPGARVELWRRKGPDSYVVEGGSSVAASGAYTLMVRPTAAGRNDYVVVIRPADPYTLVRSSLPLTVQVHDVGPPGGVRTAVLTHGPSAHVAVGDPSLSADGSHVAYRVADGMLPGDTNGYADVAVTDRSTGTVDIVSSGPDGVPADGPSRLPSISADGRYVAFVSDASNLVPGDTNSASDVFVADRRLGTTTRLSPTGDGTQAGGQSSYPSISADGRVVSFSTRASNLDPGDTLHWAVVVTDRDTAQTTVVHTEHEDNPWARFPVRSKVSPDGSVVSFATASGSVVADDTNRATDVFLTERATGATTRVPTFSEAPGSADGPGQWSLSADGRFVAFDSPARSLVPGDVDDDVDVFVADRATGATTRASVATAGLPAHGDSVAPQISADGRYVLFASTSRYLVRGDSNDVSDIFVRDLREQTTVCLSLATTGRQGDGASTVPSSSADAHVVVYASAAHDLAPEDPDGEVDLYAGSW